MNAPTIHNTPEKQAQMSCCSEPIDTSRPRSATVTKKARPIWMTTSVTAKARPSLPNAAGTVPAMIRVPNAIGTMTSWIAGWAGLRRFVVQAVKTQTHQNAASRITVCRAPSQVRLWNRVFDSRVSANTKITSKKSST
ncbi:hypothetical protein ONA91_33645 [Micromonospora sp. DR5-3]|nr:hypothetical protein [Micromonospora sp. DR5-3]MCW3819399.1 hypothetical protein [Micromonospora sp. DR5-3]